MKKETTIYLKTAYLLGALMLSTIWSAATCSDSAEPNLSPKDSDPAPDASADDGVVPGEELPPTDEGPVDSETLVPDDGVVSTETGYDGIDLLVVVDNSGSMAEEQDILSTSIFTLVNQLVKPLSPETDPSWGLPPVENLRVAVATTDLALQWGGGQTGGNTTEVPGCSNGLGMNGEFQSARETTITIESGKIKCEVGGNQCPGDFECIDNLCVAQQGEAFGTVNCPQAGNWVETTSAAADADFSTRVACLAQQGTEGCGVEQQLEAAVRGIETHPDFLVPSHLLAVLVVTDEEDCSIEDNGLFETAEWMSGATKMLNVACNYPEENNGFLFDVATIQQRLVALKGEEIGAVVFGAFVGVPAGESSPCQGNGTSIEAAGCLDQPEMQLAVQTFSVEGQEYKHFTPACTRLYDEDKVITSARPGRRPVALAQAFGPFGFVYSICNADWNPAMQQIAKIAAHQLDLDALSD